jgi:hypothetical protein
VNVDDEWAALVTTAVLGTDRRSLPEAPPELAAWSSSPDPAVALLDRAAALVTARRAGARPLPSVPRLRPPETDARPPCSPTAARILGRILGRGERELLGEWLARAAGRGWRLPAEHAPAVLHRAAGDPKLDAPARAAAGPLAAWLDVAFEPDRPAAGAGATGGAHQKARSAAPAATPSTTLARPTPAAAPAAANEPAAADPTAMDAPEAAKTSLAGGSSSVLNSRDPVEAIVEVFASGRAGALRGSLRAAVLTMAPADLLRLAGALDGIPGQPLTAPLRRELADLARVRYDLAAAFTPEDEAPQTKS